MKKTAKTALCALLAIVLLGLSCVCPAFAASSDLTFSLTEYGYAMVTRCSEDATGTVKIPATARIDGNEYPVKFIGEKAFADCKYVEKIVIPEGVTQIGSKAFKNCESLRTVDFPKSLNSCEYDAFDGCEDVTVNCYSTSYQFYSVYGLSKCIHVHTIDKDKSEQETTNKNALGDFIKRIIALLVSWFAGLGKK